MLARLQGLSPRRYVALRALGLVWIFIEWAILWLLGIFVVVTSTWDDPDPESVDSGMTIFGWLDLGVITVGLTAMWSLAFAVLVAILTDPHRRGSRVEGRLFDAFAVTNVALAAYLAIAWFGLELTGWTAACIGYLLVTAGIASAVSRAARSTTST